MYKLILILLLAGLTSMQCQAEFRDPTQPAYPLATVEANTVDTPHLILSAIWISSHSRRATINGVLAKQGQTITIQQPETLNYAPSKPENADQSSAHQQANRLPDPKLSSAVPITTRLSTIKIIRIHKNSVIIDQNGELKTLQLVHRSYNYTSKPRTH